MQFNDDVKGMDLPTRALNPALVTSPDVSRIRLRRTADMIVLQGVLGCSFGYAPRDYARDRQDKLTLRRTVQVRLGSNPAVPRDGCPARGASASAARGTAIPTVSPTAVHETSGLRALKWLQTSCRTRWFRNPASKEKVDHFRFPAAGRFRNDGLCD